MKTWAAILMFLPLAGCAGGGLGGGGSSQPVASGPPPEGYREKIAAHVRQNFFDPYSVRDASISAPMRRTGSMYWNVFDPAADWYVCMKANAKNRQGGYVGITADIYLFSGGRLVGTHTKPTGYGFQNSTTDVLCANAVYQPFPDIEAKGT